MEITFTPRSGMILSRGALSLVFIGESAVPDVCPNPRIQHVALEDWSEGHARVCTREVIGGSHDYLAPNESNVKACLEALDKADDHLFEMRGRRYRLTRYFREGGSRHQYLLAKERGKEAIDLLLEHHEASRKEIR